MKVPCCICKKELPPTKMVVLSFAIPKGGQHYVLEYKRRLVCSKTCADKLRDQKGEVYD